MSCSRDDISIPRNGNTYTNRSDQSKVIVVGTIKCDESWYRYHLYENKNIVTYRIITNDPLTDVHICDCMTLDKFLKTYEEIVSENDT